MMSFLSGFFACLVLMLLTWAIYRRHRHPRTEALPVLSFEDVKNPQFKAYGKIERRKPKVHDDAEAIKREKGQFN